MRPLLTLLLAFGLSAGLTYLFIIWMTSREIVAGENHRTMHKGRVPTGGGWPVLAATLVAGLALWPGATAQWVLVTGIVALALVSWADDLNALNPALRLAAHLGAAAACVLALPGDSLVFQGALPLILDRLVAGLALAWFINLYNFMDGIDGIAGAETITIAAGYLAVSYAAGGNVGPLAGFALGALGAAAGFLVWNWAPARIFLGDVGSVPLGFLMGWLMLDLATRHSLTAALILPLYFAADATITLLRRILKGEKPWEPHKTHFYQRAATGLGTHARVVKRIAIYNAVLVIAAVLALSAPLQGFAFAAVAVTLLLVTLERAARGA